MDGHAHLARICYASMRDAHAYGEPLRRPNKKIERTKQRIETTLRVVSILRG